MADRLTEPDGPEIVLVNPQSAHGWLEPIAMDTARARLVEFVRRADATTASGSTIRSPRGRPIYVHAKMMIVDDQVLHVGSSNMNNRSLRLDTECDVAIDAASAATRMTRRDRRRDRGLRDRLLAEHLGLAPQRSRRGSRPKAR